MNVLSWWEDKQKYRETRKMACEEAKNFPARHLTKLSRSGVTLLMPQHWALIELTITYIDIICKKFYIINYQKLLTYIRS